MDHLYDGSIFEHEGLRFRVNFDNDTDADMPWEQSDCHGVVRRSKHRHVYGETDKRPCERPLNQPNRHEYQYYYDWNASMERARKDGWNTEPYDAPNPAERAVQADFDYLRAFLRDDWCYLIVRVVRVDADDNEIGEPDYLGWVESYKDFHVTQAYGMAEEIARQVRKQWRSRLHDKRIARADYRIACASV